MGGMTKQTELPDVPKDEVQVLKFGSNNGQVLVLKRRLIELGYKLTIDNPNFGKITEAAVKDFQFKNDLVADGIVGPLTWAKLNAAKPVETPITPEMPTHMHPIDWARNELAVYKPKEILGKLDNARIVWYLEHCDNIGGFNDGKLHHDEVPWCAAFINAAATECGCYKTNNALAASWKTYGEDSGDVVEEGDIVCIGTSHVTLANKTFNRRTDKNFEGFGGNQGNALKVSTYSTSSISTARKWKPKPGTLLAPIGQPPAQVTGDGDKESTR